MWNPHSKSERYQACFYRVIKFAARETKEVRYPASVVMASQADMKRWIWLLSCCKKRKKKTDPNFPVKFESNDATLICDLVIKKARRQGRWHVLHCSACPRRFLTPSCGCLSLRHADDNEQVLPTHCISPHHLPCYLPFYYRALLALRLRRRGAPGRSAWEEERLRILQERNK